MGNMVQSKATNSDLKNLATKSDLKNLATKSDLKNLKLATKSDLKKLARLTKGDLEKYNIAWIKKLVKQDIGQDVNIISDSFTDNDRQVNSNSKEFELDVYCEEPLIIGECATFLDEDEFDKVKKLTRAKQFFKDSGRDVSKCKLYFFTFEISSDIKVQVDEFCKANNIQLITSKHI